MKKLQSGEIFCIPLFLPKDDWDLRIKLSQDDFDKEFAFGRIIEISSSVTIEIFNMVGPADTDLEEIIKSGVMISPVKIFADGILKGRWKILGTSPDYDKYRDSNYENLRMVYGVPGQFRVRNLLTKTETPISRTEMEKEKIPYATVWFPINLENRIIELLKQTDK